MNLKRMQEFTEIKPWLFVIYLSICLYKQLTSLSSITSN